MTTLLRNIRSEQEAMMAEWNAVVAERKSRPPLPLGNYFDLLEQAEERGYLSPEWCSYSEPRLKAEGVYSFLQSVGIRYGEEYEVLFQAWCRYADHHPSGKPERPKDSVVALANARAAVMS